MGLNSYRKKLEKALRKKDFYDDKLLDFVINNIHKSEIDKLISYIQEINSLGRIISKVNSFSYTGDQLYLNSGYRVRKYRRTTKKVSLQVMINKDIKEDFDRLKVKYNLTSEELIEKLLYNTIL